MPQKSSWTYVCPAGCGAAAATAPVFGCSQQNVYGVASSVCVAALHEGFISHESGGLVQISSVQRKTSAALCATANNGVTPRSLSDAGYATQPCQGFSVRKPTLVATDCAQTLAALSGAFEGVAMAPGLVFAVSCPAGCALPASAAVYGSSQACQSTRPLTAYHSASSICRAAVHAGLMTNAGGEFLALLDAVSAAPPCTSLSNGMHLGWICDTCNRNQLSQDRSVCTARVRA
jgi:hypothetical protein